MGMLSLGLPGWFVSARGRRFDAKVALPGLLLALILLGLLMPPTVALTAKGTEPDNEALLEAARHLREEQPGLFGEAAGVLEMGVVAGSQADAIGIVRGDILLRYGREPLASMKGLIEQTQRVSKEDVVEIELLRDGRSVGLLLHGGPMGTHVQSLGVTSRERMLALNQAGTSARRRADYHAALAAWRQGLVIAREEGQQQAIAVFLGNIGLVYQDLGQYPRALEHHQQALAIDREIGDHRNEQGNPNQIGVVYYELGQYPRALEHFQQALVITSEIGDRHGEGAAFDNIGNVYAYLSQSQRALEYFQQALAIKREIGDRSGEGNDLTNISVVYQSLGQDSRALGYFEEALAIHREIGDRRGEGFDLINIGTGYQNLGQYLSRPV